MQFGTSLAREALWSLPVLRQGMLDLGRAGEDSAAQEALATAADLVDIVEIFDEAARRHLRVVVVAMTSDTQRLRSIEWGEATLEPDGTLGWLSHQVLFDGGSGSIPASTASERFNDGVPPSSGVQLRPNSTKGTGNDA